MYLRRQFWISLAIIGLLGKFPALIAQELSLGSLANQEPVTAPQLPLHELPNQDLFDQAHSLLSAAEGKYRAEQRGLKRSQKSLAEAATAARAVEIPELAASAPQAGTSRLDAARLAAEHSQTRLSELKKRQELRERVQQALNSLLQQSDAATSAGGELTIALKKLDSYLYEVQLRAEDGTLRASDLPASLAKFNMNERRRQVDEVQRQVDATATQTQARLEALSRVLASSKEELVLAEATAVSAKQSADQELKQQELRKEYAAREPQALLAALRELQEEQTWLQGAYSLAGRRFRQISQEVSRLENDARASAPLQGGEVSALSPETEEGMEEAGEKYAAYITSLDEVQAALRRQSEASEAFQAEAAVLVAHYAKMQVVVGLTEEHVAHGKLAEDALPGKGISQRLDADVKRVSGESSEAAAIARTIAEELPRIESQVVQARSKKDSLENRLARLEETRQTAQQILKWEEESRSLEIDPLVDRFKSTRAQLATSLQALETGSAAVQETQSTLAAERRALTALEDSFYKLAQQQEVDEQQSILRTLLEVADLDQQETEQVVAEPTPANEKPAREDVQEKDEASQLEGSVVEYQQRVSARVSVTQEQDAQLAVLLAAARELDTKLTSHLAEVKAAHVLATQGHVLAVELKKRVGRGELGGDQAPEGITEASRPDLSHELETLEKDLRHRQDLVKKEIDSLGKQDSRRIEAHELLVAIQDKVSTRLNTLDDIAKLQQEQSRARSDLSEGELKTLEQRARRRLQAEIPSSAWFDTSDEAKDLAELLQTLFVGLLELDSRQGLVSQQQEKCRELIALAQEEQTAIEELLPVLRATVEQYQNRKEAALASTKAALKPEHAGAIAKDFLARTGGTLEIPAAIALENREEAAAQGAAAVYDLHVRAVAAQQWVAFFTRRQSAAGLPVEISDYQQQLGNLDAQASTFQRRIYQLAGRPQEELASLPPESQPRDDAERLQFLSGEIGVAKQELGQIRRSNAGSIAYTVGGILAGALVLTLVSGSVLRWLEARSASPQTKYLLSATRALTKFAIWVLAMLLVLSSLGFNIGAILAGLGIGGLAIGLASQETIQNLISGIILFIEKPIKIGDVIEVDGFLARVEGISWRTTHLTASFGRDIYIPNSRMVSANLKNWTKASAASVGGTWLSLYLSTEDDPSRVVEVCNKALDECTMLKKDEGFGTMVAGQRHLGRRMVMEYWAWFFVEDRSRTSFVQEQVWLKLHQHLTAADISMDLQL